MWLESSEARIQMKASLPPDLLQVRDPESILVTCASGALGISLVLNLVWRKASLKEPGVQIRREMLVALSAYRFLKKSRKLEYGLRWHRKISTNHVSYDDGIEFRSEKDPEYWVVKWRKVWGSLYNAPAEKGKQRRTSGAQILVALKVHGGLSPQQPWYFRVEGCR